MPGAAIDLNADVGEGCGDDYVILQCVTSANVASGGHAGGGQVLIDTMRMAASLGVVLGAHPSYPDRAGFGRTSMAGALDDNRLIDIVVTQVTEAGHAAACAGVHLAHVKAHGALYHDIDRDPRVAAAFAHAVVVAGEALGGARLAVVGPPSPIAREAVQSRGLRFVAEGFVDRAYAVDGRILPRTMPGSVIEDPARSAAQAVDLAVRAGVRTSTGEWVGLEVDTLCLHGDTPGAAESAQAIKAGLIAAGVSVRAWNASDVR